MRPEIIHAMAHPPQRSVTRPGHKRHARNAAEPNTQPERGGAERTRIYINPPSALSIFFLCSSRRSASATNFAVFVFLSDASLLL